MKNQTDMDTKLVYEFLNDLKANNEREWFHANKKRYKAALKEVETFLNQLIPEIKKFDKSIGVLAPKDCLFRIYRDIRFSKNKQPYKTNFGAVMARGGRKSPYAGYYIHFEPGSTFMGGGIWHPPSDVLKAVRKEIYFHADEFKKIIQAKDFKKYFGEVSGDKLVRPPKDFPNDFPDIDLLKFKDYTAMHGVEDDLVHSDRFMDHALSVFKSMKPFNDFLNRGIDLKEE
ncbi:MAG: DUF2461 domain-containing protein [Bacteroidales bacterium]|nr:DUF2461 domain-containing protein [Bacteroidales bacterium]MCF8387941.1 DUF2461 domain-containing protein [Bacteroidales bacterium]MCF8399317.1 DUF2461 domain-containing protein [Bacteroidales bacterium]